MTVPPGTPGATDNPQTPPKPGEGDQPKPGEGTDTGAGEKPGEGEQPPGKMFTQAELNEQIEKRLTREREANERKANEQAEAAKADALKEQSKFKELSETQATQLTAAKADVERLTGELETANQALSKHLESLRKDIPQHIIKLLDKMTPAEQLDYIAENADQLKPAPGNGTADPPKPGQTTTVPATPKPGEATLSDDDRRKQSTSARQYW